MSPCACQARANDVRLVYVWSTHELTKSLLLVGKTRFLGNGVGYGFGSNLRVCAGQFQNSPCSDSDRAMDQTLHEFQAKSPCPSPDNPQRNSCTELSPIESGHGVRGIRLSFLSWLFSFPRKGSAKPPRLLPSRGPQMSPHRDFVEYMSSRFREFFVYKGLWRFGANFESEGCRFESCRARLQVYSLQHFVKSIK